jgi:hypothetical protein
LVRLLSEVSDSGYCAFKSAKTFLLTIKITPEVAHKNLKRAERFNTAKKAVLCVQSVEKICMRKFALLAALLLAAASLTVPLSQTALALSCEGEIGCPIPKPQPKQQPSSARSTNHTGVWAIGCGIASASSLMIGTGIKASHKLKKYRRQLTVTEAAWHASACPVFLPLALIAQASCPDNKATYKVATLAYRYLDKHLAGDQSAFTAAYGEACRTQKLSRETLATLTALIRS